MGPEAWRGGGGTSGSGTSRGGTSEGGTSGGGGVRSGFNQAVDVGVRPCFYVLAVPPFVTLILLSEPRRDNRR